MTYFQSAREEEQNFPITSFRGEYRFLSNFYQFAFTWAGLRWSTSEHAYQAAKTGPENLKIRHAEFEKLTPGQVKRAGRDLKLYDGWEQSKIGIMREILFCKFMCPVMWKMLDATGDRMLIEGNTWGDQFWGMTQIHDSFMGENHLGKLLMEVRDELRNSGGPWK